MALASSSRNGQQIIWVVLHTAEGSRRRSDLYNFFNTVRSGSSHGGADGTGLDDGWVPDERAAWTLLNGNPVSLNLEMCGFARWTRAQWLSTGVVDGVFNPRQMVRNAAEWARRKCVKYNIPKIHIGPDGVRARRKGIIMHRDYTIGARDGDHTDIGNNFPWDVFFADMGGGGGVVTPAPVRDVNFLAQLEDWQQERVFNRILRMSAGVEGENHHGEQFLHEEARWADVNSRVQRLLDKEI